MHLAIGFIEELAILWSVHVEESIRPEEVAQQLQKASAGDGCCGENYGMYPDQIFMITNEKEGPEIFNHYVANCDYPERALLDAWKNHHVNPE